MNLSNLLQKQHIVRYAAATSLAEAQQQLIDLYVSVTGQPGAPVAAALAEREKLGSFVVAPGIAFPHVREDFFDDFYIFIGLFPQGVPVTNGEPIKLIVMYCVPMGKSNLYLRTMAAMSRLLSRTGTLDALVACADGEAVVDYISAHDEPLNDIVTARDLMRTDFPFLTRDASLSDATAMMVAKEICDVPVVENTENMKYLGLITTGRLLKVGIPDYLLMMDNLNFLKNFEPFQDLLRNEQSMKVEKIIRCDAPHFEADTPMFQVAMKLVESHVEFGVVVEKEKLIGTITRFDFVHKVVRI